MVEKPAESLNLWDGKTAQRIAEIIQNTIRLRCQIDYQILLIAGHNLSILSKI